MRASFQFLKPTFIVVVCYALALVASLCVSHFGKRVDEAEAEPVAALETTMESLELPRPDLSAEDVVRIQLEALANDDQGQGVLQCMTFASPSNRLITGPLERFARMVRGERYLPLSTADRVLIGKPTPLLSDTRVLVTLMDGEQLWTYAWILSKQEAAPYADCWMTDAVFALDAPEWDPVRADLAGDEI